MLGMIRVFPGLATPAGHAHELLFGFALAVVAGNQLGSKARSSLALLAALWFLARVAFLFFPGSALAVGANAGFPALLAWHLAPRLFFSAKKWRNKSLPVVLTAICGSAIAYLYVAHGAAVSVAGPIGFVGLAVPHLVRGFTGPDYRWVLVYSLVGGPLLLLCADITGRVLARPAELQVGIVTALVGAPLLIALARRRRVAEL